MNYEENSSGASIWEQRKGRFAGTALEDGKQVNPEFYMHLLGGCAYDPGEIIGTPGFIENLMQGRFGEDLEAHLSRIELSYCPCQNRDCLQTNNANENFMVTIDGELTLCMLVEEQDQIIQRLNSDAFKEICALPAEKRRPELNDWLKMVWEQAETYDDSIYWDDDEDNYWDDECDV